jgi:hypothetical protein
MAADLLDRVCGEITERLQGLRPAVEEYERLLEAVQALERDGSRNANATPPARPRRPPASARTSPPPAEEPAPRPSADVLDAPAENHARAATSSELAAANHAPPPPAPNDRRPPASNGLAPVASAASTRKERAGEAEKAIVAALEHGSHTVGELGIVTAMSGQEIRAGARRLLGAGRIVRTSREGRAAYALSGSE